MKKLNLFVIAVSVIAALLVPPAAQATVDDASLDVLVLAEGETDGLVQHIQTLGGTVKYQYRNAPVVAAEIPAEALGEVSNFAGVVKVEEDALIFLDDQPARGNPDEAPIPGVAAASDEIWIEAAEPAGGEVVEPGGYANPWFYSGAYDVWPETQGEGSIVVVVDSGVAPNACLDHAVIGAPGYPDGYNATGDGIPATSPQNNSHGTFVAGAIASRCSLNFSGNPNSLIYLAQKPYLGWLVNYLPIFGQAPGAQIYPVKVFPYPGITGSLSTILDGLDHVLTLKKTGVLDIDIVNMSIQGMTWWDGRDASDRFLEELQKAGILVVTIAGNFGPTPNSVSNYGTSFGGLSVGALDYAASSRVYYEYAGLVRQGAPGQGMVLRPTNETRVASFSGRGPLSDGRSGPEIAALGASAFSVAADNVVTWFDGTSIAAPAVAGAAALLNSWWEAQGRETDPVALESALLKGADPNEVGEAWRGANNQGYGALDAAAALEHLKASDWQLNAPNGVSTLKANALGEPVKGKVETWQSETITLAPGQPKSLVFEISKWTSKVTIDVTEITTPDNRARAIQGNALNVYVQSAKRTGLVQPVSRTWYPYRWGNAFQIVIEDGPWTSPWGVEANQAMEPGLMKLSLGAADWNEAPVSFKVRIERENFRVPPTNRIANGVIERGDMFTIPVDIPPGTTKATFDLIWHRDWSMFPTTNVDMLVYNPERTLVWTAGIGANAPERVVVTAPVPGTWTVRIRGFTAYKPDNYDLYLTLN